MAMELDRIVRRVREATDIVDTTSQNLAAAIEELSASAQEISTSVEPDTTLAQIPA